MKKSLIVAALALVCASTAAKDIKTLVVTTTPEMHCEGCENKIKGNIRFVKGIKSIETSVPNQTVTITYDADKQSEQKILDAFGKIGYTVKKIEKKETK